jgi:hypothetical protein
MILHFLMFPALPLDPEEPFAPVAFLMTTWSPVPTIQKNHSTPAPIDLLDPALPLDPDDPLAPILPVLENLTKPVLQEQFRKISNVKLR